MSAAAGRVGAFGAALHHLFLLAVMVVVLGILTAAMAIQLVQGELPCPLCLLERVAMFGVCFAILLGFRNGFSDRVTGMALLAAILLLVIATRQTLLDIAPRPGHAYIGSAVLGLHMPVWSILVALAVIAAFAVKLIALGSDDDVPLPAAPIRRAADLAGLYFLALLALNLVAVVLQCGLGECHTFGYRLLGGPTSAPN